MTDPFDLQHVNDAQPPVYPRVLPKRFSRAKMVNSRLQAVGRDVERRNRDRQPKASPAGASRI